MKNLTRTKYYLFIPLLLTILSLCLCTGCERQAKKKESRPGTIPLAVWAHAGQEAERVILQGQVARFNQQSQTVTINLTFIPERDYNAQIQSAAIAGDLPDILEFDGPYLYNYIWQNHLIPLEDLLPQPLIADILPSIIAQGTHADHLYSVGVFDSGLGLYGRKDRLAEIGHVCPKLRRKPGRLANLKTSCKNWRKTIRTGPSST